MAAAVDTTFLLDSAHVFPTLEQIRCLPISIASIDQTKCNVCACIADHPNRSQIVLSLHCFDLSMVCMPVCTVKMIM